MNKYILFIALIIFQPWTLAWGASYKLLLKNGSEIKTSHYWEEGNEIKFYLYGGVVGVPRANVIGIKSSKAAIEDNNMISPETVVKDQKVEDNSGNQTTKKEEAYNKGTEQTGVIDANYYKSQKAALKDKLDDVLERNRQATRRKDQEAKYATRLEMREYVKKIMILRPN